MGSYDCRIRLRCRALSGILILTAWRSMWPADRGASQWRFGFGPNPTAQWGATTYGTRWNDYWVAGDGLPVNRWIHTAAVFDQTLGQLHLYVDGREVRRSTT